MQNESLKNNKVPFNKHIEKRFSTAATRYDTAIDIQSAVANHLKNIVCNLRQYLPDINTAIDIGCGTGLMTEKIFTLFPSVKIFGIDIAQNMVALFNKKFAGVNNVEAIHSDFLQLNCLTTFDMAFSSSALHWILPLDDTIKKVHQLLNKKAPFFCGMMVKGTFSDFLELKKQVAPEKSDNNLFLPSSQIIKLLKENGFSILEKEEKDFIITYNSTRDFMKKIHQQGTTATFLKSSPLVRKELEKLIVLYDKQFIGSKDEIEANYKTLFFYAQKL
jgi:malonyl-CoA O-methyltransferase